MLLYAQGKGQQLFHVVLDSIGCVLVQRLVLKHPGCVQAEVHSNLSILLEASSIELRAEAGDLDSPRLQAVSSPVPATSGSHSIQRISNS